MFCLNVKDKFQTMEGDSGGPVVDKHGKLVGLVTGGKFQLPDINVNVMYYLDWIQEKPSLLNN